MEAIDRKNLRLLAALFIAVFLCCGVAFSGLLWQLIDVENHLLAYAVFVVLSLLVFAGAFSLDALATVLRLGFARAVRGTLYWIGALAHGLLRAFLVCVQGSFVLFFAIDPLHGAYPPESLAGGALLIAAMIAEYVLLHRLEKRLRAQRALKATFD